MNRLRRHAGLRLSQRRPNRPFTRGWKGWTLVVAIVGPLVGLVCGVGERFTGGGLFWRGFLIGFAVVAVPVAVTGLLVVWCRLLVFLFRDAVNFLDRDLHRKEAPEDDSAGRT
jgi:hypothetical protein